MEESLLKQMRILQLVVLKWWKTCLNFKENSNISVARFFCSHASCHYEHEQTKILKSWKTIQVSLLFGTEVSLIRYLYYLNFSEV